MSLKEVVGIVRKSGEYNGRLYDNYQIHTLCDADESKGEIGRMTEVVKIKVQLCPVVPKVGDLIRVYYSRTGQVEAIEIEE